MAHEAGYDIGHRVSLGSQIKDCSCIDLWQRDIYWKQHVKLHHHSKNQSKLGSAATVDMAQDDD